MIDVQGTELIEQMRAFAEKYPGCRPPAVTFARERIVDVFGDIKPLLQAHWEEIAHYPDIPLAPDYERYVTAERLDLLRIFTARQNQRLIGYAIYAVQFSLHYKTSLQAQQDILYVAPEHRKGRLGWKLIQYCDQELKEEGCQCVIQHIKHKAEHNFGPMLARMGYEQMDELWVRRLD